jgi:hypothetical protein
VPIAVHPGHWVGLQPFLLPHVVQSVAVSVPMHVGPVVKMCGGDWPSLLVAQQIWLSQSLSELHALAHVSWQTPMQQSFPIWAQSDDVVHVLGQGFEFGLAVGFRHNPLTFRLGSTVGADVQQTSPEVVSQSLLDPHIFGHWLACVQNGVE